MDRRKTVGDYTDKSYSENYQETYMYLAQNNYFTQKNHFAHNKQ